MQLKRDQYRHTHLSAKELLDYINDQYWDHERHEIERHLLNCAMCEEALEGLASIAEKEVLEDMDTVRKLIRPDQTKKLLPWHYAGIAASAVILMVSILVVGRYIFDSSEEESIALKEEKVVIDSLNKLKNGAEKVEPIISDIERQVLEPKVSDASALKVSDVVQESISVETDEEASPIEPIRESLEILEEEYFEEASEQYETVDAVFEEENLALGDGKETGNHFLDQEESAGLAAGDDLLMGETAISLSSQPKESSEEEMASKSRMLKAAKKIDNTMALRSISTMVDPVVVDPEPIGGYDAYERYLRKSVIYPPSALADTIEGTVILQFSVGAAGNLFDFKVKNGLNDDCNNEAIRLVVDGPKWVSGTTDGVKQDMTVSLTVTFKISE